MVTATAINMKNKRNAQCSATKDAQYSKVNHNVLIDIIFTLSGIVRCFKNVEIYGPKRGCSISQSYSLLLPRKNNAAARSSNGVVGSTGRKIPKIPKPKDVSPNIVRAILIPGK